MLLYTEDNVHDRSLFNSFHSGLSSTKSQKTMNERLHLVLSQWREELRPHWTGNHIQTVLTMDHVSSSLGSYASAIVLKLYFTAMGRLVCIWDWIAFCCVHLSDKKKQAGERLCMAAPPWNIYTNCSSRTV